MSKNDGENTVEYWQQMQRNLFEQINGALHKKWRIPKADIESVVMQDGAPLESEVACDIANVATCAVEIYKLQNGIKPCKCGRADIVGTALQCKVCDADVVARRSAAGFPAHFPNN